MIQQLIDDRFGVFDNVLYMVQLLKNLGVNYQKAALVVESIWPWAKPKGMHWRTWERLRQQEEQAHGLVLADLEVALERLWRRL